MPTYQVEDAQGRVLELEGDHEPSQEEAATAFASAFPVKESEPAPSANIAGFLNAPDAASTLSSPVSQRGAIQAPTGGTQILPLSSPAPITGDEIEATLTEPAFNIPENVKDTMARSTLLSLAGGREAARGIQDTVAGVVEGAASPGGLLIAGAQLVPGVNVAVDTALAAGMAKSGAEKLGEASVTGSLRTAAQGASELLMAAGGAVGLTGKVLSERRTALASAPTSAIAQEAALLQDRLPNLTREDAYEIAGMTAKQANSVFQAAARARDEHGGAVANPERLRLEDRASGILWKAQGGGLPPLIAPITKAALAHQENVLSPERINERNPNASQIQTPAEVHGDVLRTAQEEQGAQEVPVEEGQPGVRAQQSEVAPNSASDLQGAFSAIAKGATDNLYEGIFNAARQGKRTVSGVREPLIQQAKPYIDQGLINSPAALKQWVQNGMPRLDQPITGMGGATPSEFVPPPQTTSTKNALVERERADRGLPPAIEPARRAFGAVWDEAMAKVDADPLVQDKLIASLRETPRAVTDSENALLLHRQVDLQNEYGKATRDLAQAVDDGRVEDVAFQQSRVDDFSGRLLDLYDIGKKVGTETGRGLAARRMLANEDFTLANMVTERRAVNKGKPLTPKQLGETAGAQKEITSAIENANAKPSLQNDFALDQAKKKWTRKLAEEAEENAPGSRIVAKVEGLVGDVRTLKTAFDFSAFLRQGKLALATHPLIWARSIAPSIQAARSPLKAFEIERQIATRRNAPLYARSGLYLAETGGKLSSGEEAFVTKGLAHKIPGVKGSEHAYVTFLNKLRADIFDSLVNTLGKGSKVTLPEAKVVANYVNQITGRGDLGKAAAAGRLLSTTFFSPRFLASRFQYLLGQPLYYGVVSGKVGWRAGARARKLVAWEYGKAILGLSTIYGLYALAFGEQQSGDPFSSDFAKLRTGDTRVDPWAGLQQATVFLGREIFGKKTTMKGKTLPIRGDKVPYGGATAVDVGTQFLRSKLAPVPGALVDIAQGKNIVGEPVTPGSIAMDLTIPITYQDILTTLEEQGVPRGTALTLLSLFGEGVNTYSTAAPPRRTK